jgi:Do/DeqQ family serine protease
MVYSRVADKLRAVTIKVHVDMKMRFVCGLFFLGAVLVTGGKPAWAGTTEVPSSTGQITLSYAPLVKKTAPAVVNIYTKTVVQERARNPLFSDPFFKQFFGNNFNLQLGQPKTKVKYSLGSGVIIDPSGTIVTNNHVIEGADQIRVVLPDRREFDATVVGADERTDLAVLHIDTDGEPLPFIAFQDSDHLEVGDLVLAIGNPFGVGQTVTSGIVSALARTQVGVADVGSFIQTDAAINPGNSGGALVSMSGQLVGINTAIFSNSGGSLGIGFAVPSNMVRFVIEGLEQGGRVVRPWMGAWGQAVTSDMAEPLGFDRPKGVLINNLWPGAAAERGSIQVGDVIVSVNGRDVNDPKELEFRVASLAIGGHANLVVIRNGASHTLQINLEVPPEDPPREQTLIESDNPLSGASILNFNPAVGEEFQIEHYLPGVLIVSVKRGTPASRLGFRPGDRLMVINGEDMGAVSQIMSTLDRGSDRWDIKVDRNGRQLSLMVGP